MSPTPQRNDIEAVLKRNSVYTNYDLEKQKNRVLYRMIKRSMDFTFALIGLILLSPLFLIISIFIKLEDPKGSIFFYQTRIGKDERPFRMYKFRSMVSNAEELLEKLLDQNEINGAMFKMREDPRTTRIGKIIRKTSIDELPQLWNVILGEMSLVGPRPALPREVNQYSSYDKLRLKVIPGCTGLWQVSGRNELSFHEMVELDLEYIRERSVVIDLKIIIRTFKLLFGSKNAF
ncbi:MAG: sugar transferase [Bacillota bacterium]